MPYLPEPYTLVYFEVYKRWGQFTGRRFMHRDQLAYEVDCGKNFMLYPTDGQLIPVKDYHIVTEHCR